MWDTASALHSSRSSLPRCESSRPWRDCRRGWPAARHQFFDFPLVQQTLLVDLHPSFLLDFLLGIELARHCPQMLASMVEVDNLNGPGKVFGDQIPYPFRAVQIGRASCRERVVL